MGNIVGNLFREVLGSEETRMPVRDYAAMLYRGMQQDMDGFRELFLAGRGFSDGVGLPVRDLEFNTLEAVYARGSN